MLRTTIRICLAVTAASILVASAASAAPGSGETTLVLYAENRSLARVDINATGPDNGDYTHRELALSRTLKGPVIGVSYAQAVIVAYNPEAKVDTRAVDIEDVLPGGVLFYKGITKLQIGTVPQPGWTADYAVTGGTGKYKNARGIKRMTLLADGITFKSVITFVQ
jgi:hypothetical protein